MTSVYAPNGMVATSQPLATAEGLAVLERGGNAIDAAVVAAAVLSVVEPHMTGIGGDMFALLWSARQGRLLGLNASGRSGSLMTRDELASRGRTSVSGTGAESITIPSALAGWDELLRKHGTITLEEALAPAIRIADQGFEVTPIIARQWANNTQKLLRDSVAKTVFLVDGRAPRAGEMFRNPDYANTLRMIAWDGAQMLYGGTLGAQIGAYVRELGGFITTRDFARNEVTWVEPMSVKMGDHRVWQLPPNGQGLAVLEMLRLLESTDLKALGHNTPAYLHHLIEAKKLAYADLARVVGDPDRVTIDPARVLADDFIAARSRQINPSRAATRVDPAPDLMRSETIYLAVADSMGNMVSFINSIYQEFGSGVVVPGMGFALHDRGAGFSMDTGRVNTVAPNTLPFHTLIPGFVTKTVRDPVTGSVREEPWMAYGVMGGAMQPQGHVQLLHNILTFGMDVQAAIEAPRFRHQSGVRVALEAPISAAVRSALSAMGHEIVSEANVGFGGAQAVIRLENGWRGGSDPRKDGLARGH